MRKWLAAALVFAAACQSSTRPVHRPPEDLGERRDRWLFEQRAYPFDSVPGDLRRNALRELQRTSVSADASPDTDAAGSRWRTVGPQPVETIWPWGAATGRVKALAVSPADPSIILAGSSSGGIWRSSDGGAHFTPVSDGLADLAVGDIAFAPSSPAVVYASMGSDFLGTGLLRSDDGGAHWRTVSGTTFTNRGTSPRLVIDPADPNRLWVAQYSRLDSKSGDVYSSGLLRSNDGGVTWVNQFTGLSTDVVAQPGNPNNMLLGVMRDDRPGGGAAGIYRTTNGGASWSVTFNAGADAYAYPKIAVTPAQPLRAFAHVFISSNTASFARFLMSDDGGVTWSQRPAAGLPEEVPVFLEADPANPSIVYAGMRDLYKSVDAGLTFTNMTRGYSALDEFQPDVSTSHVDQHALTFHPQDSRTLFLGNDGGVFRSQDGGSTFTSLSGTLSLVQAYGIAAHPTDPDTLFLGTQDNGLERGTPGGSWRELITGDYGSILFDVNNPDVLFTNYVEGEIVELGARGDVYIDTIATNETFGESADGPRIGFIAPFERARTTNTFYFGSWRLFVSRDLGRSWTAPGGMVDLTKGGVDTLSAIGLSDGDANVIYTGSSRGRLMVSRDGGATWSDVTTGLPNRSIRAILVDPANANVVYVGVSGYAAGHVWKTTNGGASWTKFDAGLVDVPVNALLQKDGVLYAGTDIGVFRNQNGNWEPLLNGMPPVIVTDFAVTAGGRIVAGTHGRGAYELVATTSSKRRTIRH